MRKEEEHRTAKSLQCVWEQKLVEECRKHGHFVYTFSQIASQARLDAALEECLPNTGLRARRRLWEWCTLQVNGRLAKPATKVQTSDTVAIYIEHSMVDEEPRASISAEQGASGERVCRSVTQRSPVLLKEQHGIYALYKPHGLHTVHIAGSVTPSLEDIVRRTNVHLFLGVGAQEEATRAPHLVTRLDRGTAGIVLALANHRQEQQFRLAEEQGKVRKTYYAIVHGRVEEPFVMARALDTAKRKKTRVLSTETLDTVRHTSCVPLGFLKAQDVLPKITALTNSTYISEIHMQLVSSPRLLEALPETLPVCMQSEEEYSLLEVTIQRGCRHQIRAHLAHTGHPIVGDWLYQSDAQRSLDESLFEAWASATSVAAQHEGMPRAVAKSLLAVVQHKDKRPFFLQHSHLAMEAFQVQCLPLWVDPSYTIGRG